jgi:hypothetical protein
MENRSPVVPPGLSPAKRPRPPEGVFVLVPVARVEPNKLSPAVLAVVVVAGVVALVALPRFPNNPPPAVPILFPNKLPLGAAAAVPAVFKPRAFDVAGAVAPSGGLGKLHVVAAVVGEMVNPVGASEFVNYPRINTRKNAYDSGSC